MRRRAHRTGGATDLRGRHHPGNIAHVGRAHRGWRRRIERHDHVAERGIVAGRQAEAAEGRADVLGAKRSLHLPGEGVVGRVEGRRAEPQQVLVHGLLQRRVGQQVAHAADDLVAHRGLGHQRRSLGDAHHAGGQRVHLGQFAGAHDVAHLRAPLHHVGRHAAGVQDRVVDARIGGHVLAHVVDADVHQFHRVQRRAAQMRSGGGVAGTAAEVEVDLHVGQRGRLADSAERRRVPGQRDVDILQRSLAHHEQLAGAVFLGRAAVVAHPAGDAVGRQPVLHRSGGQHGARTQQVMAATVAGPVRLNGLVAGAAGLLAEAGEVRRTRREWR